LAKLLGHIRRGLNVVLKPAALELRYVADWDDDPRGFIPFSATLSGAATAGLSVADYVDATYNRPGATQHSVEQMAALGAFEGTIERVCEIGPGSGRYLERVQKLCHPAHYEIYETAPDWAEWLVKTYGVIHQPTDGTRLASTPSRSMDLVQAHKVFGTTPTLVTCHYLEEMARVVKDKGKVLFDVMTERCLDEATLARWFATGVKHGLYPAMMPRQFLIDMLARRGLTLRGTFLVPMEPGMTECMLFIRDV
jgi:Methyltransferase domain